MILGLMKLAYTNIPSLAYMHDVARVCIGPTFVDIGMIGYTNLY